MGPLTSSALSYVLNAEFGLDLSSLQFAVVCLLLPFLGMWRQRPFQRPSGARKGVPTARIVL